MLELHNVDKSIKKVNHTELIILHQKDEKKEEEKKTVNLFLTYVLMLYKTINH